MTVSIEDVKRIRDALAAKPGLSEADVVNGTRTEVHALLQLCKPAPHTSLTAEMRQARESRLLTRAELEEQAAHQRAQVSDEERDAFARARARGDSNALHCADAHHYAQMLHGNQLWIETDALCAQAGVK